MLLKSSLIEGGRVYYFAKIYYALPIILILSDLLDGKKVGIERLCSASVKRCKGHLIIK